MHVLDAVAVGLALSGWVLAVYLVGARYRRRNAEHQRAVHFNSAAWRSLPPVRCPLLIKVEGKVLQAERTTHIERSDGDMEYVTQDGRALTGRFDWTYP